jgi:hypothetical protein
VRRLRELSGLRMPYMRPSVREVIDPETLEEAVLSTVIKHLALGTAAPQSIFLKQCCGTVTRRNRNFLPLRKRNRWYRNSLRFRFWFLTGFGSGFKIKWSIKIKRIKNEMPTFWEIMLLLRLKKQDFVQLLLKCDKYCLDPGPEPKPEPKLF